MLTKVSIHSEQRWYGVHSSPAETANRLNLANLVVRVTAFGV
jgi:hypothetical protein